MRGATRPPCSNSPGVAGAFPFPSPFEHATRVIGEFTARLPNELARVAPDRTWDKPDAALVATLSKPILRRACVDCYGEVRLSSSVLNWAPRETTPG